LIFASFDVSYPSRFRSVGAVFDDQGVKSSIACLFWFDLKSLIVAGIGAVTACALGRSICESVLTFSISGGDMYRATFLLAVAVGLAASLTISAEARASSTLVSVDVQLSPLPTTTTVTGLTVTLTGAGNFAGLAMETPTPSTGAATYAAGDTVTVSISSAVANAYHTLGSAFIDFTFVVPGVVDVSNPTVAISSAEWLTNNGGFVAASSEIVSFSSPINPHTGGGGGPLGSAQAVPEPTGLSLLGIGMIGLVTYGRFMKRVRSAG
jgi:hypothetical protein